MMRVSGRRRLFAAALLSALATAGCAAPATAGPAPSGSPAPSTGGPPQTACALFLPDTPCGAYASVSGRSGGKDLAWAASGAVVMKLESFGGQTMLSVRTPCNPLSGPATVTGDVLTVRELGVGAMGCAGEKASQERWVADLLRKPVTLSYDAGKLSWSNGADSIIFAPRS